MDILFDVTEFGFIYELAQYFFFFDAKFAYDSITAILWVRTVRLREILSG